MLGFPALDCVPSIDVSTLKGGAYALTNPGASAPVVAFETAWWLAYGADARHANATAMLRRGNHETLDTDCTHRCCTISRRIMGRRARDPAGPLRNPTARDAVRQLYRSRQRYPHAYHCHQRFPLQYHDQL